MPWAFTVTASSVLARSVHRNVPPTCVGKAGLIVTAHSPADERNSTGAPSTLTVKARAWEASVAIWLVNDGPPRLSTWSPEAAQERAIAPGGGDHTAGVVRLPNVTVVFTPPLTETVACPRLTEPVIPGDDVGTAPLGLIVTPVSPETGEPLVVPLGPAGGGSEMLGSASPSPPQDPAKRATAAISDARGVRMVRDVGLRSRMALGDGLYPTALLRAAASIAPMLDRGLIDEVLRTARRHGGSFAEVFVEERSSTSIRLDDGKVEELTTGLDRGAGVRVALGTTYGYAYSNRLDRDSLLQAAEAASAAVRDDAQGNVVDLTEVHGAGTNRVERPAGELPAAEKVAWLRELDDTARAYSPEVVQVTGVYGDSLQRRLIATSEGVWVQEDRPRIRLVAQVVAKRGDNIQTGFHGPAACGGVEFLDTHGPRATAEVAAKRAVTMLDSIPAPAGEMTVVLGPGMGGVLFHEAVGHPLEADAVDKEASVYRGLVGTKCASELIHGVDDATIPNGWGSYDFDDEAQPSQRTQLFVDGVLQGFLYDRLRAEKDGVPSTGNGRRESYAHPPVARMTNTYILNGASSPADVLSSTASGVYVTSLGGGQVNPASGDFVFGVSEGFLIEDGRPTTPVRGANLIGRAIEVMSAVDAVADDFDTWEGVCGKDGQSAPVGSGSPTPRISKITVGGTGA